MLRDTFSVLGLILLYFGLMFIIVTKIMNKYLRKYPRTTVVVVTLVVLIGTCLFFSDHIEIIPPSQFK